MPANTDDGSANPDEKARGEAAVADEGSANRDDEARGETTVADAGNAVAYEGDRDEGAMSSDGFDGEGFDGSSAYGGGGDGGGLGASALFWFSAAGAAIMGALWLGDAVGAWEFFLGDWLTLGVAALAAVGAALTARGRSSDGDSPAA